MSDFNARPFVLTATDTEGRVKEMTERLEQGVKELFESERYQAYLRAMSKFHDYSLNNTLLILLQKPDASLVAGYGKWRDEFERHVKAEEKGIKIFAPAHKKIRKEVEKLDPDTGKPIIGEDGKPVMEMKEITIPRYKVVNVFDVSQTDGKEIPDMSVDALTGSIEQYEDFWRALKEISPVPVELEKIESGAHGYYSLADKRIAIDEGMSELQTIKTLIHEIAHAKLHDIDLSLPPQERQERPNQRTREVEAESIAYTVCQHFGLETSEYSFGYIAGWSSDKEIAELKASLETIRQTASELIGEIEGRFAELQAQREAPQVEQAEPLPPSIDPAVQPVVTIIWSESDRLQDGEQMPLPRADALFKSLDEEKRVERETPGYEGSWYDKTKFRIDFTFKGERDNYEGRQDFGDGDGSLIDHIRGYHEYYAQDEHWKTHVLRNDGAEAWEQEKAQTDMLLHEFVPYLELHRNLSQQERTAAYMLEAEAPLTPEQTAYFNAVLSHVDACREKLNSGDYDLPDPPQLADFDKELQDYKAHVEEEIAQEAAAAGMTVEEYVANSYEPVTREEVPEQAQEKGSVRYYPIHEEAARRANDANSFRDYKAGSATAEYRRMVDHAAELAQEQKGRVDPMYHERIDTLLDTYARRLAENMNKHYDIEARVPSVMIAGSSNFPVRKKEKQNAARDRNMQKWQDVQGLLDKIRSTGMGGISADDPQAVQKLESKLASLVEAQENMKAINAYYRKHGTLDGCTVLPEKQIQALQQDMKSSWHLEPKPFQSYELSNNNAEIRRTRARIEELKRHGEKEYSGWTFDGGRVEANKEANRLQIFFDGKPDEATREELKANGFRWAPSAGAWQRQLNDNAYRAAGYIPSIQPIAVEPPVPDASLTGERVTTPRGSFHVTALRREQMEAAGYGVHHQSEDRKYLIMGNGTRAFAVAAAPPENYLKNAEMSTEQNYNMIDGQINNTPTVDELEEKAKRGELISLTALAAAVKAEDSRKPQREPEGKKPSIRAQLKADKARAAAQPKQQEQAAKRSIRQSLEME